MNLDLNVHVLMGSLSCQLPPPIMTLDLIFECFIRKTYAFYFHISAEHLTKIQLIKHGHP